MKPIEPKEFKITALRECAMPEVMLLCEMPENVAEYWHLHVERTPHFNPDCECLVALLLNTRRRLKGHQLLPLGTMDAIPVDPRRVQSGGHRWSRCPRLGPQIRAGPRRRPRRTSK